MFEELRSRELISVLLRQVEQKCASLKRPARIMEICGTHTVVAHKSGLSKALEGNRGRARFRAGVPGLHYPGRRDFGRN